MSKLKSKTIYSAKDLFEQKSIEISTKFIQKEKLEALQYEMASVLSLYDKDGNPDPKQVKIGVLKEAVMIAKLAKKNATEEKFNLLETYIATIDSDESLEAFVQDVIDTEETILNAKEEYKALKKEITLEEEEIEELEEKGLDEKQWFEFTESIVKEEAGELNQELKEKEQEEKGGAAPKEPKVEVEIFSREEIKQKIRKK